MIKLDKRQLVKWAAIALAIIIVITLITAPSNNKLTKGSSYSLDPDGYGAWLEFMANIGKPVERWQKPLEDAKQKSTTLLRIYATLRPSYLAKSELDWLKLGNTLIILGVKKKVTSAPFSTWQDSVEGKIKIDTSRRARNINIGEQILGDRWGAVMWQEQITSGKIIYATTPYLAANAYQDHLSNYQLLAQVVNESGNKIYIDEYIHGYKDQEIIEREKQGDLLSYLVKTPLFVLFLQGLLIITIAIVAFNKRFGAPTNLTTPSIDNSLAYIQAKAAILEKAQSNEFILEVVGKEQQRQLQKALGLGETLLDKEVLIEAWCQQTGQNDQQLKALLLTQSTQRRLTKTDLLAWLDNWRKIRPFPEIGQRKKL